MVETQKPKSRWIFPEPCEPPQWLIERAGYWGACLLWQRNFRSPEQVEGFLNPDRYVPSPPSAFGVEMEWAVSRMLRAQVNQERVLIWGDFDSDGITSTAVLWDGLGPFYENLSYYIPDRHLEGHGISERGIAEIKDHCDLIITCDTGSTSLKELEKLQQLNIDVIVTDHHTLPVDRPPVIAIINPRYLPTDHPLYHLSGVGTAYKLVEAFCAGLGGDYRDHLRKLLDLVAIGLVADLVQLTGEVRYLAQKGMQVLAQKQRPGIKELLDICKQAGDRAIDISFGIAPRLNSISRVWGDVRLCVELLTTTDPNRCQELVSLAETANGRRKELQEEVAKLVKTRVEALDLTDMGVIVVTDPQWEGGVLGLAATKIAQEYCRPTIVGNIRDGIVRCSGRSYGGVDLYELLKEQSDLLLSMGGHPYAGGLSLKEENLDLFTKALNYHFRQKYPNFDPTPTLPIDLTVTIADLNKDLFNQLKALEPFGMGNPAPKFLIKNVRFVNIDWNDRKASDGRREKLSIAKSKFQLQDSTGKIPSVWWGHGPHELPKGQICHVVGEFIHNSYHKRYELRLEEFCLAAGSIESEAVTPQIAIYPQLTVVSDPSSPFPPDPSTTWQTLVGIAKYLYRTKSTIALSDLQKKIQLSHPQLLDLGLSALAETGLIPSIVEGQLSIQETRDRSADKCTTIDQFLQCLAELEFRQSFSHPV